MERKRVVIIGAGLGGCVLAHSLRGAFDVVMIEHDDRHRTLEPRIIDHGHPAGEGDHLAYGLGGSTRLWHNGLIEIDDEIFDRFWPIGKAELTEEYAAAFQLLSGVAADRVKASIEELAKRYRRLGIEADRLPGLFYPRWPMNVWDALAVSECAQVVRGTATDLLLDAEGAVHAVQVSTAGGDESIPGDVFVLAAGGLGTPLLLQRLSGCSANASVECAGRHYEDHPMGFVGEVELKVPLYRLWNFHVRGTGGNLRMPLVVFQDGLHVSFQLRPAAVFHRQSRRERVGSVLNELRRNMWDPRGYFKLLSHWDDILDILSFKFGIHVPTRNYTLLMVAQMPTDADVSVWREGGHDQEPGIIGRRWTLSDTYRESLDRAVERVIGRLSPVLKSVRVFPAWQSQLRSAAHHSGTARMSRSPGEGVCDAAGRVHGIRNLFVCDGSAIPASGIANTGLTIAALALRLGKWLRVMDPDPSGAGQAARVRQPNPPVVAANELGVSGPAQDPVRGASAKDPVI